VSSVDLMSCVNEVSSCVLCILGTGHHRSHTVDTASVDKVIVRVGSIGVGSIGKWADNRSGSFGLSNLLSLRLGYSSGEGGDAGVGEGGVGVASIVVDIGVASVDNRGNNRLRGSLNMHILLSRDVLMVVGNLFMNIGEGINILMNISFSRDFLMNISLSSNVFMYIGLSSNVFMNIGLSSNVFMNIRFSFNFLMNIRNSSNVLLLCYHFLFSRSGQSKGRGEKEECEELHDVD